MAAYRRVYDSRHMQADCQELGPAPEPYARQLSMGYFYLFLHREIRSEISSTAVSSVTTTRRGLDAYGKTGMQLTQLVFDAILWVKLVEMLVTLMSLKYALSAG